MYFYPFEVTSPHIIYALLGAFVVLFGMFSLLLREKLYIGEAILAFAFGVIMGPYGANIFNPRAWGNSSNPEEPIDIITIEFTRVVLAIGIFAVGVELPNAYMVKHWKSLFFLLVPAMTWGWFICAGFIHALIPGLNFLSSLAISACLTPTDPILASAVVGGKWADKHVPAHIRHLLAAESGCNDGASSLFLFFALYLMTNLPNVGNALKDWFLIAWLYQVILGILIGSFLGFSFRHLMKFCQRHDLIDRHSYVAQYLSLAILTIGLTTLLGSDDLLAAFACGTSFAWDGFFNKQTEESVFSSVIDTLFNVAAFIFVGAWMPFRQFHSNVQSGMDSGMGAVQLWRLVVLAILVLLLRRLPIMMAMYRWIPDVKTWREAIFIGHFGPMGIGAIFISTLANQFLVEHIASTTSADDHQQHQLEQVRDMIQPIVAFVVIWSITIHGLSISGFSLGRRVHSVSRTWSRRDTIGSRVGAPDWTNQARLVTRAEDIVINQDLERGDDGGVPLEKTTTTTSLRTLNDSADGQGDDDEGLKSDAIPEDKKPQRDPIPAPAATEREQDDCRNQFPPDGKHHQTSEWIEGDQTVVERNRGGFGDDVEVTVIEHPPHVGKKHRELESGPEEKGHSMRDGVRGFYLGRRRPGSARDADDRTMRPTTADTLVAQDEPSHYPETSGASGLGLAVGDTGDTTASELGTRKSSSSLTRLPSSQNQQGIGQTVNLNLDTVQADQDYDSDVGDNSGADNEGLELRRGREGRLGDTFKRTMSGSSLVSGSIGRISRGVSSTPPPPAVSYRSSSILPPIFPSPTTSHSRPRTAPSAPTLSPSTAYPPSPPATTTSRSGTDDSTGSIQHHRLNFIRASDATSSQGHRQGHRTPPRDSSPSRSVRFVDGESGSTGNGGRKVIVVVEMPPAPSSTSSSSRSSSLYRDRSDARTLVEEEGDRAAAAGSSSVPGAAATLTSRPPTR